jgi:hypothetical protein
MTAKSKGGQRREGSIIGDEPDVAKKAPLNVPEPEEPQEQEDSEEEDN